MLLRGEAIRKKKSAHTSLHTYYSIVNHLNWSKLRPARAGVIPYIIQDGKILFAFGLDAQFRELTDFGGGVSYKKDKTAVVGALREFREESLGIFQELEAKDVEDCFVMYNLNMMIIFLLVDVDPKDKNKLFHEHLQDEENPEVCDIVWLSEEELNESLNLKSRLIYVRVRDLIVGAGDFNYFLIPNN